MRKGIPDTPYTINAGAWCPIWDPTGDALYPRELPEKLMKAKWKTVVYVTSVVYAIGKIFVTICQNFDVELDDSETGVVYHLEQVEAKVASDSIADMIFAVEDLFHVLYSRLQIEIGNIQLYTSCNFNMGFYPMFEADRCLLPEPSHVFSIFIVCRSILRSRKICGVPNRDLIQQHQETYLRRMTNKFCKIDVYSHDYLGYRRHLRDWYGNRSDYSYREWCALYPLHQLAPKETLALLSECYILKIQTDFKPYVDIADMNPPFVDPGSVDPEVWEQKTILSHRTAALAMLSGTSVGEIRREEEKESALIGYIKEKRCVCRDSCSCAEECTQDAERLCPCSQRVMRAFMVHESNLSFQDRCTALGQIVFQTMARVRRDATDSEFAKALSDGIDLIRKEIMEYRETMRSQRIVGHLTG